MDSVMFRAASVTMMAQDDGDEEEWKPPSIFSAQNAGPFLILIVIGVVQSLLPIRESLPMWVQEIIPVVLGRQAAPPDYVPPGWFFWY